jgi:hypothetical protein
VFTATVKVVGLGTWGPFKDATGEKDASGAEVTVERFVPYVDFAHVDGSGSFRATARQGVETPALFSDVTGSFEFTDERKTKWRYHGPAETARVVKAA